MFEVSALCCRTPDIAKSWQHLYSLVELGQHVTSARVLLSVDVASFDVVVGSQREHDEEDEAKMLHVLSLTLDDQVVTFVQIDQLLDRLLPGHLLLVPCLGLPKLRQSFHDRAVQLDPLLYIRNILEHIESNVDLQ